MEHGAHRQPVGRRRRRPHHIRRDLPLPGELLRDRGEVFLCSLTGGRNDDQLLLCPGEGDIQHAELLALLTAGDLQRERLARHGVIARAEHRIPALLRVAVARVQQHRLRRVADEAVRRVGEDADGEFQPLARVDAHELYPAVGGPLIALCRREVGTVLAQTVKIGDKAAESLVGILLVAARVFEQHPQIIARRAGAVDGGHDIRIRRARVDQVDQLRKRHRDRHRTVVGELVEEGAALHIAPVGVGDHRGIQGALRLTRADAGKVVLSKAEDRAHQHREQLDIQRRVVDHAQQIRHQHDLTRGQKAAAALGVDDDSAL